MRLIALTLLALAVLAPPALAQELNVPGTPVPRAQCGPGSQPESPNALQGEIPNSDKDSGRAWKPYTCNMTLTGNDNTTGTSWQNTWSDTCDYYDTSLSSGLGVQVVDVSDPSSPKHVGALQSPAMLDPWESLSVADHRADGKKLLAGVYVSNIQGGAWFDVYDVGDCKHPKQTFSGPVSLALNHEGNWSMDGMTYYATSIFGSGNVAAIDVTDPTMPKPLTTWPVSSSIHGLSSSDDGNRLYVADITGQGDGNGLSIWDTSSVQSRQPVEQPTLVGAVGWKDGSTAQMTIPVTIQGHPYIVFADELGAGAARIIDIADEKHPKVVSELKLEIQLQKNQDRAAESAAGSFGYNAHYCGVDSRVETTIVVCSMFDSGLRVFDVRDPVHPKEIAYFNPGGTNQPSPPGSQYSFLSPQPQTVTAGYPSARPRIIRDRGEIWFTDQNHGFMVVRFTNGVWPFKDAAPTPGNVGLPKAKACLRKAVVRVRLRHAKGARSAVVQINGKRVRSLRGAALRRPVAIRLPKGHSVVRIVVRTRGGKRIAQTKDYTRCA